MNFFAVFAVGQGVLFKVVSKQGVNIIEYMLFRNAIILLVASVQLSIKRLNPLKGFPRNLIANLLIRSIAGQLTFGLVVFTMTVMPVGTAMIIFQMNPFWTSILACVLLKEKIRLIEILGIFVCFGGVVMIGFAR